MRNSAFYLPLVVLGLAAPIALAQSKTTAPRHPIAVSRNYFANLNARPKHTAAGKLSPATQAAARAEDPRIISVPHFTGSFSYGGNNYSYTMVGQHPSARKTTVVPTTYIPLSFYFDEFIDQNGNNIAIDTTILTNEIKHSPLFENAEYATGFTQFVDAQMRAEFYPRFNRDGDNDRDDSFHVLLTPPQTLIPVTIEVPPGSSQVFVLPDGNYFALIDINFIDSQLNTMAQTEPIDVRSIPIFLGRNVVLGDFSAGQPLDCCVGGFHTAFEINQTRNKTWVQTLAFSTSLDPDVADGIFGDPAVFSDINALSHELAETMNDPFVNNVTPSYQLPGAPPGECQNTLEVADVIENLPPDYTDVTLHGFTYHPQTLGLLQWFEGKTPSNAFDGDYSFPDRTKLTAPFTPCPAP
jgi:hypothetical protein